MDADFEKDEKEILAVEIGKDGVEVTANSAGGEGRLFLSASEALMLLDILETEAGRLREMAREGSPIPIGLDLS